MTVELRGKFYDLDVVDTLVLPMMTTFGLDVTGRTIEANLEGVNIIISRLAEPSAQRNIAYTMTSTIIDLDSSIAYYRGDNDWKLRASIEEITNFLTAVMSELASENTEELADEKPKRKGRPAKAA